MSDFDFGDRTMPPTERRRREARRNGQVARSSQLTSALILLVASSFFWWMTPFSSDAMSSFMRERLVTIQSSPLTIDSAVELLQSAGAAIVWVVVPTALLLATSSLMASFVQVGLLWAPSTITPRFRRQRIHIGQNFAEFAWQLVRFAALACVAWRFIQLHDWQLRSLSLHEPARMLAHTIQMLSEFCFQLSGCLVLLGLVDYGYRFWRHEQGLKMTVEERRQEQREDSINPRFQKRNAKTRQGGSSSITLSEIRSVGTIQD
jgi:flagellar biosynthetic protein FlhB